MKLTTIVSLLAVALLSACSTTKEIIFVMDETPAVQAPEKIQTVSFKDSEVPTIVSTVKGKKITSKIILPKTQVAEIPDAAQ